jgi:hypothetical protein
MRSDFADERRTDTPHWAERLVRFLDDGIVVPGTGYRMGVDGLLGMLVPVLGDATTAAAALSLFWLAVQRGVPRIVLARMALNVGLDALLGSVPIVGDLFDFVWKANRKNLALIQRATSRPQHKPRALDYVLLAAFVLFVTIAVALPFVVMGYLIAKVMN